MNPFESTQEYSKAWNDSTDAPVAIGKAAATGAMGAVPAMPAMNQAKAGMAAGAAGAAGAAMGSHGVMNGVKAGMAAGAGNWAEATKAPMAPAPENNPWNAGAVAPGGQMKGYGHAVQGNQEQLAPVDQGTTVGGQKSAYDPNRDPGYSVGGADSAASYEKWQQQPRPQPGAGAPTYNHYGDAQPMDPAPEVGEWEEETTGNAEALKAKNLRVPQNSQYQKLQEFASQFGEGRMPTPEQQLQLEQLKNQYESTPEFQSFQDSMHNMNSIELEKARLQTNQPQQMNEVQSKFVNDRAAMNREYSRGFKEDFR